MCLFELLPAMSDCHDDTEGHYSSNRFRHKFSKYLDPEIFNLGCTCSEVVWKVESVRRLSEYEVEIRTELM